MDMTMTKRPKQPAAKAAGESTSGSTLAADANPGLLRLLHRAAQVVEGVYARHAGADGLTSCQNAILSEIATDVNLSQVDICERTGIDRSTVADVIRRLEQHGLVERKRTAEDARRYALTITPSGSAALEASSNAMLAAETQLSIRVGGTVLLVLAYLLGKLVDSGRDTHAM